MRLGEFSMVIDTDYVRLYPNVKHKPNTQSNEPEEMEIDDTTDSIGPIHNNIGEHQYQATPAHVETREDLELYLHKCEAYRTHILAKTIK